MRLIRQKKRRWYDEFIEHAMSTKGGKTDLKVGEMLEALIDSDFNPMPTPDIYAFGFLANYGTEIEQLASALKVWGIRQSRALRLPGAAVPATG